MDRYKVIVNPTSGRGAGERAIPAIAAALSRYGLDFDMVRTERPWHAAELAQQAAGLGYSVVVAAGGDGTANEVLNGLMRARQAGQGNNVALGVLTVGTGNDLAFAMGLPADLDAGCRVLAEGRRRPMDVGRVVGGRYPEGRYFGNGVGIGFDAVVSFEAQKLARLRGFACYFVAALRVILLYYQAPRVRIEYGDRVLTQRSLMVSIMNGRRMGGGFLMAPQGNPGDGLLDLCIAGQVGRAGILAIIPRFLKGTQEGHHAVAMARAERVVVTALEGTLPAHCDGETLCTEAPALSVELLPRQLEVICGGA